MEEEVIDYLYNWATSDGFKKSKEDFVKLLQTNDEALSYAFEFAQKDGFKKDKNALGALVGRTTTAAPVATAEPAKTEPAKIELATTTTTPAKTEPAKPTVTVATETAPAKTEPAKELSNKQSETIKVRSIPQREVEMPVADETKMPPMMVREAEPEVKEEPKKEMPIGENLLPVTEKTEVKAVETPSDKMVIKSEKKAEEPIKPMTEKEKEEWECPPAQGGCSKNKQSITNYFLDKYKIGGEYKPEFSRARISDREGNLADFIDNSFDGRGVAKIENEDWYDHNSKGYYYIAEENPKSKRFSVYNVPVDGKETSLIYDNKTGVIMKETNEDVKSEDGKPMKTWLNVPFKYDEYNTLKAEIDKSKGGTTAPKVSTVPTLEPWQQPMQVKEVTEQPKAEVKAEEPKGKMKVAPEPIKIEPIKIETKGGQIQVEVPTFAIPEPKKKYKPYGDKGPDVYYSEDFDQFIIKEGNERTVASKGSPKYAEIETKLSQAAGATKEGKGKCDTPPFIGCSPNKTALNEFLYYKDDEVRDGYRSTDEGGLIEQLDDRKRTIENRGESLWSIYNNKNPNEGIGDIYYANEEPPKSDRFVTYKPYGNDKTLIYDKESGAILKQLDGKAPKIDAQKESSPIYDTKGNIIKEKRDTKETWRNYSKNNPNEGMTVWQGFEIDHPKYKELKSIIEGIDYKKAKGSKNTSIPTFNPVPETPEWQK
jgi:hypothetical protein